MRRPGGVRPDPSKFEDELGDLEQKLMLTTLDKAVAWAQANSIWPDTFGLACCAMEMIAVVGSRYDIARFGAEVFRSSPRQADLLIVSGRVAHKMAAPLRQIYDQMVEPKWVMAMGACASSGGMFNNYAVLQGVDKVVPVDIYVPGCPPRPEACSRASSACRRRSRPECRPRTRLAGSPRERPSPPARSRGGNHVSPASPLLTVQRGGTSRFPHTPSTRS